MLFTQLVVSWNMRVVAKIATGVLGLVGTFVTISGVPDAVTTWSVWLGDITPYFDQYWIRATLALFFIALVSISAFWFGFDWRKRPTRKDEDSSKFTLKPQTIVFVGSDFQGTVGGVEIRQSSTQVSIE